MSDRVQPRTRSARRQQPVTRLRVSPILPTLPPPPPPGSFLTNANLMPFLFLSQPLTLNEVIFRSNNNAESTTPPPSPLILAKRKLKEVTECIVCQKLIKLEEDIPLIPCLHILHEECLQTWLDTCDSMKKKRECPICRFDLTVTIDW